MALAERRYRRNRIVRFNRQPVQTVSAFPRLHPKGASSRSGRHVGRWPPRNGKAGGFPHSSLFIFQSSGFIHFRAPAPTANSPARRKKSSDLSIGASCWRYLSSRAVTRKVLSAQMSLTSVFGMGTGGPSSQSTPTIWIKAFASIVLSGRSPDPYVKAPCALTACVF